MPTDKNTETEIKLIVDPNLKTPWIDTLVLAQRLDGISCVRLATNLPEGHAEQVRFMTGEKQLKEFVNLLCLRLDYFPDKKKIEKKLSKKAVIKNDL